MSNKPSFHVVKVENGKRRPWQKIVPVDKHGRNGNGFTHIGCNAGEFNYFRSDYEGDYRSKNIFFIFIPPGAKVSLPNYRHDEHGHNYKPIRYDPDQNCILPL